MKRRAFLIGAATTALAAAWARVVGAVGIVTPLPSARPLSHGDILDRIFRDLNRRRISSASFRRVRREAYAILGGVRTFRIDRATAAGRMRAIHAEALLHPDPPREIPPLRSDEVGVGEVMALLRRVLAGEILIEVWQTWKDVHHTYADFKIDGWMFTGFRRTYGLKYVENVTSPDGRRGSFESFERREGNPVDLLENDEQDCLDDLIEAAEVRS